MVLLVRRLEDNGRWIHHLADFLGGYRHVVLGLRVYPELRHNDQPVLKLMRRVAGSAVPLVPVNLGICVEDGTRDVLVFVIGLLGLGAECGGSRGGDFSVQAVTKCPLLASSARR